MEYETTNNEQNLEEEAIQDEEEIDKETKMETAMDEFKIALVGIGQGGGNIVDAAMIKTKNQDYIRYNYLEEVIGERAWAINTGPEIKQLRKRDHIPKDNCFRIGTSAEGAGGKPGNGWEIFDENEETLEGVLDGIEETNPSVIIIAHSAAGGTGGGGAPYFIKKVIDRFLLGKGESSRGEMGTYVYTISVLPMDHEGEKYNMIYSMGKIFDIYKNAIEENDEVSDRYLPLLMSNAQFYQALYGEEIENIERTESDATELYRTMNPIPTDVLSQILYSYLGAQVDEIDNLINILDPSDLIRAVNPERPFTTVNIIDDVDKSTDLEKEAKHLCDGNLEIRDPNKNVTEEIDDDESSIQQSIKVIERSVRNARGVVCKLGKPNISRLLIIVFGNDPNIVNDQTMARWKNTLTDHIGYINYKNELHDRFPDISVAKTHTFQGEHNPGILTVFSGFIPKDLTSVLEKFKEDVEAVGWKETANLTGTSVNELKRMKNNVARYCLMDEYVENEEGLEEEKPE